MSVDKMTPVAKLLQGLMPLLYKRAAAYDVTWKFPLHPARRTEAKARMAQAELQIEDKVRTWVYESLISELKTTEAHKDEGHFDHSGVEFVIDYLVKNRPELAEIRLRSDDDDVPDS